MALFRASAYLTLVPKLGYLILLNCGIQICPNHLCQQGPLLPRRSKWAEQEHGQSEHKTVV
jgi:hypothetical protein